MASGDLHKIILVLTYLSVDFIGTCHGARSEDTDTRREVFSHSLKLDMAFALEVNSSAETISDSRKPLIDVFRAVLRGRLKYKVAFYSRFFPDQRSNATKFATNCHIFNCTAEEEGPRKKGSVFYWVVAVAMPLLNVFFIIVFTSNIFEANHSCDRLNVFPTWAIVAQIGAMVGCAGLSLAMTICYTRFSLIVALLLPISWIFAVSCLIATFRCVHIDFARPEFTSSPFLQLVGMLRVVVYFLTSEFIGVPFKSLYLWGLPFYRQSSFHRSNQFLFPYVYFFVAILPRFVPKAIRFCFAAHSPPSLGSVVWLCLCLRNYILGFYYWGNTSNITPDDLSNVFVSSLVSFTFMVLCFFTPYARDRQFIAVVGFFAEQSAWTGELYMIDMLIIKNLISRMPENAGSHIPRHHVLLTPRAAVITLTAILASFLMRYQRVLPRALRKARYVRLGYLYEMRRKGVPITRCQDIPAAAFGNPAKAVHLIIVSHRWLDRYSCDVITAAYPQGLRLTTMCQRLETLFPFSPVCSPTKAMSSALYSGHDVLIFFDFMSAPQIGKTADGALIERTIEEQSLFQELLPAMGALYTMYPVLACPEVLDGMPPYFSSGWCFCEWEQAKVYSKLINIENDHEMTEASAHNVIGRRSSREAACEVEQRVVSYMRSFETDLATKRFFFEGDRKVVHGIVEGTLVRRMLVDAVLKQDLDRVHDLLMQLSDHGLHKSIDYAVDHRSLDTLLHIAMRLRSKAIVDALVTFGADTELPNYRGDMPGEFFMISTSWLCNLT